MFSRGEGMGKSGIWGGVGSLGECVMMRLEFGIYLVYIEYVWLIRAWIFWGLEMCDWVVNLMFGQWIFFSRFECLEPHLYLIAKTKPNHLAWLKVSSDLLGRALPPVSYHVARPTSRRLELTN